MTDNTPTTGLVRDAYVQLMRNALSPSADEHRAEFDRYLDRVKREAAAQALEAAADRLAEPWALWHGDGGVTVEDPQGVYPRPTLLEWLHARAATIRTEATA